jgi:hypothetical protein
MAGVGVGAGAGVCGACERPVIGRLETAAAKTAAVNAWRAVEEAKEFRKVMGKES